MGSDRGRHTKSRPEHNCTCPPPRPGPGCWAGLGLGSILSQICPLAVFSLFCLFFFSFYFSEKDLLGNVAFVLLLPRIPRTGKGKWLHFTLLAQCLPQHSCHRGTINCRVWVSNPSFSLLPLPVKLAHWSPKSGCPVKVDPGHLSRGKGWEVVELRASKQKQTHGQSRHLEQTQPKSAEDWP